MLDAFLAAGFVGIEAGTDGVIYARTAPHLPEFSATPEGDQEGDQEGDHWRLSIQWPLRATDAQRAVWATKHPYAPLDVDLGETRMQMLAGADGLAIWRDLVAEMVEVCTQWRRQTRQMDEGM